MIRTELRSDSLPPLWGFLFFLLFQVEVARVAGRIPDLDSFEAGGSEEDDDEETFSTPHSCWRNQSITVRVRIKRAIGLPAHLANFVFCQYCIWGDEPIVVAPLLDGEEDEEYEDDVFVSRRHGRANSVATDDGGLGGATFKFSHCMDFNIPLSEEFIDHCLGKT